MKILKVFFMVAILAAPSVAIAQTSHEDWSSYKENNKCWASTSPKESVGNIPGRTSPYLSIQNDPGEGVRGSIAIVAGYDDAGMGTATLRVDGKKFDTLTFKNAAFVASGKPEADLIAAMRRGGEMVVEWKDTSGNSSSDTYSLMGFTAAKSAIDQNCR